MASPRRRSRSPEKKSISSGKTMAYYLKDRPEGIPMSDKPSVSKSPRHNKAVTTKDANTETPSKPKSISRLVAPRLKLVDGQVVLDESVAAPREDLTLGMTVVQEEPNRYFTSATYSKRATGSNRWTPKETELFFEALAMCGTDFSMISTLFPHRTRNQIKSKYKIEERTAPHRISTALMAKKPLETAAFATKLARALSSSNKGT